MPATAKADGRLRVSIIGPRMLFGEYELFVLDLIRYTDPKSIKWEAVCSMAPDFFVPHPEIVSSGAEMLAGWAGAQLAAQRCDLAITWGVPSPESGPAVLQLKVGMLEAALDPSRIKVDRSRLDTRSELKRQPEERLLGFAGELIDRNNPYALVQAIRVLNDRSGQDVTYVPVFIGEGENIGDLHRYILEVLGYEAPVVFTGERPDIGNLLAAVDVLVAPQVCPTAGHQILSAWALGTPVIGTPMGIGAADWAHEAMLIVPLAVENADRTVPQMRLQQSETAERIGTAYADAILSVFQDREATASRVTRGRELLEQHYAPRDFGERWTAKLLEFRTTP